MKTSWRRSVLPALLFLLCATVTVSGYSAVVSVRPATAGVHVATGIQSEPLVSSLSASSGAPVFRGHTPPSPNYDEQVGMSFTQDFTAMAYNVTAVEQTDQTLGTGPGYLLSGFSAADFWYQVGVSWDWSPGIGFAMSYEVFNPLGNSIFPTNGGGGLAAFSGQVNGGDNVTLALYFNSGGQVVMRAQDTATGAFAEMTYSAEGSTHFVGTPNGDANADGYFTGLMTEWYHGAPYYSNLQEVIYSSNRTLSSAWLWMDEFNANNGQIVFSSNSTSVTTFGANPTQLQEFSYGSITEYCNALVFITGPTGGTTTTSSTGSSTSTSASSGTATASTTTVTSTEVVTTTVPVTVTQTETTSVTTTAAQPVTTTVTATQTTTVTATQPVTVTFTQPTTVTVTQPTTTTDTVTMNLSASTTTTTQTETQTVSTATGSLPIWSYGLMLVLLLGGLGLGYAAKRPDIQSSR